MQFYLYNYQSLAQGGGGGEGVGSGNPWEFDCDVQYIPRVGILIGHHAFDLSISNSRREVNHLLLILLTVVFCPGVGILKTFFL